MPGFTPVLNIPYPLLNETVDPAIFQQFATVVNSAIATNQTSAQYELTGKPTFRGAAPSSTNPAIASATPTIISLQPITSDDNNSFWNSGAPTRLTINTAGVYLITVAPFSTFGFTTMLKLYVEILYNGVQTIGSASTRAVGGASNEVDINIPLMWPLFVGDFLQFRWQWFGTGTNQIFLTNFSLMWLCPLV